MQNETRMPNTEMKILIADVMNASFSDLDQIQVKIYQHVKSKANEKGLETKW